VIALYVIYSESCIPSVITEGEFYRRMRMASFGGTLMVWYGMIYIGKE